MEAVRGDEWRYHQDGRDEAAASGCLAIAACAALGLLLGVAVAAAAGTLSGAACAIVTFLVVLLVLVA